MTITVELPERVVAREGIDSLMEAYVVELCRHGVVSAGRAAEMLGADRWTMEKILWTHQVPSMTDEEFLEDIENGRQRAAERREAGSQS